MKGGGGAVDMGWTVRAFTAQVHSGWLNRSGPLTPRGMGDGDENEDEDEGEDEGQGEPSRGNLAGHVGIGSLDLPHTRSLPPAISFAR